MEIGAAVLKAKRDSAGRDLRNHLAHFIGAETSQERARHPAYPRTQSSFGNGVFFLKHRQPVGMVGLQ